MYKPSRAERLLKQEIDKLKTALAIRNTELETKTGFVSRLEYLLALRTEHIDSLNGKIEQLRDQNKRLDQEAERLAEMVRLT